MAQRCPWCGTDPLYQAYHDQVWGRPVADSQELFAKLCLDGQQAGLSWITILKKQPNYESAFAGFNPERIVDFDERKVEELMANPGIVRNRLKIRSIIRNAEAWLRLRDAGQPFNQFVWETVDGVPLQNRFHSMEDVPAQTGLSDQLSRRLKKAGFSFAGSTIVYAFMQACGLVNDHLLTCPTHAVCASLPAPDLDLPEALNAS